VQPPQTDVSLMLERPTRTRSGKRVCDYRPPPIGAGFPYAAGRFDIVKMLLDASAFPDIL
jgi:hypothetical protein